MMTPPTEDRLRRALILLLPLLVYAGSLGHPFQYDDFHSIVNNDAIRSVGRIPTYFVDPGAFSGDPSIAMYRPLLLATYALNHAVSGYEAWSYHLVNGALHAACTYALYLLATALGLSPGAATLAALVFALHPANAESVNYISSRSELLVGLFVLVGLWLHMRFSGAASVTVLYALGLGAKSVAVVLPVLCLGYDLLCRRAQLRQRVPTYAAMAAVTALYLLGAGHFLKKAALDAPVRPFAEQIWSQVKALVFYVRLLAVPRGLSVEHQFQISDSLWDPFAASAALVVASALAMAALQVYRRPLVAFLAFWWLVCLAPSSLVPLNVLVNEHRLYLPSAAFALVLGLCSQGLPRSVRIACGTRAWAAAGVVLLGVLGVLTIQRSQVWASDYALWQDAARKAPLMARPHIMLAEAHARDGRPTRAMAAMAEALERDPAYVLGYELLARLHREAGRLDSAEQWLRRGLAVDAGQALLWGELGTALVQRAQTRTDAVAATAYADAHAAFERAVDLAPEEPSYRNNLGNALQVLERPAEALVQHRVALSLQPHDPRTLLNLGNAHQMLGALDSAETYYRRALTGDPSFAGAWLNLASVLERRGEAAEALSAYGRAAALDARHAPLLRDRRQRLGRGRP